MLRSALQRDPRVANNVGVMNYTFPIEPACTAREFRDQLGYSKWQVVVSAAANRAFAGSGVTYSGALASRFVPDMAVGRSMLDALFSFMVMALGRSDAVHLYSTDDSFDSKASFEASYSRQKVFIAAAYDKTTGRVHLTLQVNPNADEQPSEAQLRAAGFVPFARYGPFDRARLPA